MKLPHVGVSPAAAALAAVLATAPLQVHVLTSSTVASAAVEKAPTTALLAEGGFSMPSFSLPQIDTSSMPKIDAPSMPNMDALNTPSMPSFSMPKIDTSSFDIKGLTEQAPSFDVSGLTKGLSEKASSIDVSGLKEKASSFGVSGLAKGLSDAGESLRLKSQEQGTAPVYNPSEAAAKKEQFYAEKAAKAEAARAENAKRTEEARAQVTLCVLPCLALPCLALPCLDLTQDRRGPCGGSCNCMDRP